MIDLSQREATVTMLGDAVLDYSLNGRVAKPEGTGIRQWRHRESMPVLERICGSRSPSIPMRRGEGYPGYGPARIGSGPRIRDGPGTPPKPWRAGPDYLNMDRGTRPPSGYAPASVLRSSCRSSAQGGEIIEDPHLEARGFWDTVNHPEVGPYKQVTTPWTLSKSPRQHATPAPGLGGTQRLRAGRDPGAGGRRDNRFSGPGHNRHRARGPYVTGLLGIHYTGPAALGG